ncbi:hypothetical protein [Tsuneonella sp. HG222]
MKNLFLAAAVAALALTGAAADAQSARDKGEAKLARLLEGRAPGSPANCISTMRGSNALQVIDETALIYRAGDTIWVARPRDPDMLDSNDVLVLDRFSGSQLCAMEPMRTIDRYNGFYTGSVFLSDFVPYTKVG